MAQLIVPSVNLELKDQYSQHYSSDVGLPFQINPANELKPVGEAMQAFAQYDARVKESESNIEAQQALNDLNEYKSKRLTDLEQMPLGKAVDAYQGLDKDLELFAKERGGQIKNAKAKQKFDLSAGSSLSDGRARGYALHAQQVTKHEASVDSATIDTTAQDVASQVGTPEFQTGMQNFRGVLSTYADKYGLSAEERVSYEREQTKKVYVNAGNNLITTKQFGACAKMLADGKNDMDQYTYNDISAKLKAAQIAEAEHQEAQARARRNQALSEQLQLFSAAEKAGMHDDAKKYAGDIGKTNPALGHFLNVQANNSQAQTGLAAYKIAVGIKDSEGMDKTSKLVLKNMVLMSPEDQEYFQQNMMQANLVQEAKDDAAEAQANKQRAETLEKNLKDYSASNEHKKAAQTAVELTKYAPERIDAITSLLSSKAVEYYDELMKSGIEAGNDAAIAAGAEGVNTFLPNLGHDNQIDQILKSRQNFSDTIMKQAEKTEKTNIAHAVQLYSMVANDPRSTATAREQAQLAIKKIGADQLVQQADGFIKNKNGAALGSLLWTKDQDGNQVPTIIAQELDRVAPTELTRLQSEYERINADAIVDRQTSAVKNKGFSPEERKVCLDNYLKFTLDGENGEGGLVQKEMILRGMEQTEENYKAVRAQLKDQVMPQAMKYVQEQSDAYYEQMTAQGAQEMSMFRNAERAFYAVIESSPEMKMLAQTTTQPFSMIPQKIQNEILSAFNTKEEQDAFVERFNNKHSNHAVGNPQSMDRVISDIDAGVYNNMDLNSFSKQLLQEHKDLNPTQLNECEKVFKESVIKDRNAKISNRSSDLYQIVASAWGFSDFKDLDKGSPERMAVIDTVAELNQEVRRRAGFTSDPNVLTTLTFQILGDKDFLSKSKLMHGAAQTYEMITDNWEERVQQARTTEAQEQEAGAYKLSTSHDDYMTYSHDLAGYKKLQSKGSVLGTRYQWKKTKEFLSSFTSAELEQLKKDQAADNKRIALKNTEVEE